MESSSTSFSLSKRRKTVDSKESQELDLTSPDVELRNAARFLSNSRNKPFAFSNSGGASVAKEMYFKPQLWQPILDKQSAM
ncbi:hypothetical protein F3Y22_tig00112225pilonHSYRG00025 [Hibiscus syriacus]|uniref:Uncharacterized protein n=1 Tax=Hibiscus syriacus TaxID=106335 RepID=A0A6A2X4G6_HIBSY|nr:hypothetical protein F3Y22_tig00112225pilonHSYRG00025 [Hibiscus syriacus]